MTMLAIQFVGGPMHGGGAQTQAPPPAPAGKRPAMVVQHKQGDIVVGQVKYRLGHVPERTVDTNDALLAFAFYVPESDAERLTEATRWLKAIRAMNKEDARGDHIQQAGAGDVGGSAVRAGVAGPA